MKCKKCGTELRNDDTFCYRCGERTTFVQRMLSNKSVIGSIIAIIVVAVAVVFTYLIMSGKIDFNPFSQKTTVEASPVPVVTELPQETVQPEPVSEPAVVFPLDVTKEKKSEIKPVINRASAYLAFASQYYADGSHSFRWNDVSATIMSLYQLQFVDETVHYGDSYSSIQKKVKREMKNVLGKNAKYDLTYGGSFPDYVYVQRNDSVVFNATTVRNKNYTTKIEKIIEYKEDKLRVIVNSYLISTLDKTKSSPQKYTVYVEKNEEGMYGYYVQKVSLYKKKDSSLKR